MSSAFEKGINEMFDREKFKDIIAEKDRMSKLWREMTDLIVNSDEDFNDFLGMAGTHVTSLKSNKHIGDGHNMYGMWKGVRVVVKKTNGKISTIFPDKKQPSKKNKSK